MAKKKKRRKRKKYEVDGETFDSKLEAEHYKILRDHPDIKIADIHKTFQLIPPFQYMGFPQFNKRTHRKMIYTPDFILNIKGLDKPVAMETKGHARKDYMIRKKLFTLYYGKEYYFYQCGSEEQLKADLQEVRDKIAKQD